MLGPVSTTDDTLFKTYIVEREKRFLDRLATDQSRRSKKKNSPSGPVTAEPCRDLGDPRPTSGTEPPNGSAATLEEEG